MKLNKENLKKLGLSEDATEEEINEAIANSIGQPSEEKEKASGGDTKAGASESDDKPKANSQADEDLMAKVTNLEKKLSERESAEKTAKAQALVNSAVDAGKILPRDKNAYLTFAKNDFDAAKEAIDELKANSVMPGSVNVNNENSANGKGGQNEDTFANAVSYLGPLVKSSQASRQAG